MLSVQELLENQSLGLTLLGGREGTLRLIAWAHTVELADPWHWLSAGDLLMCTGLGLPTAPAEQAHWLEQLATRNISAVLLARPATAPPLSKAFLQAADRLRLPVLAADFSLEFARLSRLVIGSVLRAERSGFAAAIDLFGLWAKVLHEQGDLNAKLARVARYLHLCLALEDERSGQRIASCGRFPASTPREAEAIPMGGRSRALLRLWRQDDAAAPSSALLLRSLSGLLAVELERLMLERDTQRREGAALLQQWLSDDSALALVRPLLEVRKLFGDLLLLAISPQKREALADLHHSLALADLPALLLEQDKWLIALVREADNWLPTLQAQLGAASVIGISGRLSAANGFAEALRQAHLALSQARENGNAVQRYGEISGGLLPHSLAEARLLVERHLSALLDYDREHGSALVKTLMCFFDHNSLYKATCLELGIHRQTLVYRLKLIEQLTKLKPSSSEGFVRLWLAIEAGRAAGLL